MKYFSPKLVALTSLFLCGFESTTWISFYETASAANPVVRLVHSAGSVSAAVENIGTGEKWQLPIRADKLTYPLWEQVRFTFHGERALVPVEKALGCLLATNVAIDETGRKRCFELVVIDCRKRKEIGREEVSGANAIKFGWIKGQVGP